MAGKRIATRFIRDANGNVVQSSANLSGVRRWITGIQVIGCPKRQIQEIAIEQFGHGEGYKYSHDYEGGYVPQSYLPEGEGRIYYMPSDNGMEARVRERLEYWRKQFEESKKS